MPEQRAYTALNTILAAVDSQRAPLGSVPGGDLIHPQTTRDGEAAADIQLPATGNSPIAHLIEIADRATGLLT